VNFFETIIKIITQTKSHYGGYIVDVPQAYLSQYYRIHPELPKHLPVYSTKYCNGRFYFLSKEVIKCLICKRESIKKEYLEDYAIGFHMDQIFKEGILNINTNKQFVDIETSDYSILHNYEFKQ